MPWKKLGLIFAGRGKASWRHSHAALPVPVHLHDDTFRVFFSARDDNNRARLGSFDLLLQDTPRVLHESSALALDLGSLGAFDDSGVTSSCVVKHAGQYLCFYTGWALGVTVPFYFYIGLAAGETLDSFTRFSPAPILGRSSIDPYLTASPFVFHDEGVWRMWYVSADRWEQTDTEVKHYYHIRYAESPDGYNWQPTGRVCIDFESPSEYAFARPCVLKDAGTYRMWYSVRGDAYRIGYAESKDGLVWTRMDSEAGIEPSGTGWDSEMLAYPYIFRHRNELFMLYNGNGYGKSGIGLAVWQP